MKLEKLSWKHNLETSFWNWKWSFDGYSLKINCSQHYVRWIGICPNQRLTDNRVRGSQTCPVETRVNVRSHNFVRVHGQTLKNIASESEYKFQKIHKSVSDSVSEIMIEPMWLCPCPPLTLLDILKSGPQGLKWPESDIFQEYICINSESIIQYFCVWLWAQLAAL